MRLRFRTLNTFMKKCVLVHVLNKLQLTDVKIYLHRQLYCVEDHISIEILG